MHTYVECLEHTFSGNHSSPELLFFNSIEPCQKKFCQHLFKKNLKYLRYHFLQLVCSVNLVALFAISN